MWDVNWLNENRVFAWHVDTTKELQLQLDSICSMTMDDIIKQMEEGNNVLRTIKHEPG